MLFFVFPTNRSVLAERYAHFLCLSSPDSRRTGVTLISRVSRRPIRLDGRYIRFLNFHPPTSTYHEKWIHLSTAFDDIKERSR